MTMQRHRQDRAAGKAGDRRHATPGTAGHAEWEARVAEGKREARRQREIFEARRGEILAAHPGKDIAVCAGEVFAGDTPEEAALKAWRAHGGRASYFYTRGHRVLGTQE